MAVAVDRAGRPRARLGEGSDEGVKHGWRTRHKHTGSAIRSEIKIRILHRFLWA